MKIWTAENIAYLKANYDSGDLAAIAKHIGVTVKTVRNKAYALGLYRPSTKGRKRTPSGNQGLSGPRETKEKGGDNTVIPRTAMEYFKAERNKHTEPYRRFYDEALEAFTFYDNFLKMEQEGRTALTDFEKGLEV